MRNPSAPAASATRAISALAATFISTAFSQCNMNHVASTKVHVHDERHQVDVRVRELRHEVVELPAACLASASFSDRRPLRGGRAHAPCRARLEQRAPTQHGGEAGQTRGARGAQPSLLGGHEARRHAVVAVQVRDMLGEDVGVVREHGGGRDGSCGARAMGRSRGSVPNPTATLRPSRDLGDDAPRKRSRLGVRTSDPTSAGLSAFVPAVAATATASEPRRAPESPTESSDGSLLASSPRDSSRASFVVPAARVSRVAGRDKTRGRREERGAPQGRAPVTACSLSPACDRNSTCARLRSRKSSRVASLRTRRRSSAEDSEDSEDVSRRRSA